MPTFHNTINADIKINGVAYGNVAETADFGRTVAMLKTTTLADTSEKRISGLKDSSFKLSVNGDQTAMAALDALLGVDGTPLIVGPMGTTTGNPKYTVSGTISKIDEKLPVGGKWTADIEFSPSGDVTVGVY